MSGLIQYFLWLVGGVATITTLSIILLTSCERRQALENNTKKEKEPIPSAQIAPPVSHTSSTPIPSDEPSTPKVTTAISRVYTFAEKLAQAALDRTTHEVTYDGRYIKMGYPMGDVPSSLGVCTDVVIRSYRQLGIDLQELLHKDISKNFNKYPNQQRWGLSRPDTNIDHRRVPNLRVFFERFGDTLSITDRAEDYLPGDIVTWKLNEKMVHIGIVAEEGAYLQPDRHLIIHNIGRGPELSDMLFEYEITGHYRYSPNKEKL